MSYLRKTFWEDPYIEELPALQKLIFAYLISNPKSSLCGIYEITLKRIGRETGCTDKEVTTALEKFKSDKKAYYVGGFVVMANHVKNQDMNANMWKGAHKQFNALPQVVKSFCKGLESFEMFTKAVRITDPDIQEPDKAAQVNGESLPAGVPLLDDEIPTMTFSQFKTEMENSGEFLTNTARKFGLSMLQIESALHEFIEERRIKSDWNFKDAGGRMVAKSIKDNRSHFYNILKLQGKKQTETTAVMPKMNEKK
jgi:hypothetical protein